MKLNLHHKKTLNLAIPHLLQLATARICSDHFKREDITKTLAGKGRLKPGAVPMVFTWKKVSTRKPPKQR